MTRSPPDGCDRCRPFRVVTRKPNPIPRTMSAKPKKATLAMTHAQTPIRGEGGLLTIAAHYGGTGPITQRSPPIRPRELRVRPEGPRERTRSPRSDPHTSGVGNLSCPSDRHTLRD